MRCFAVQCWLYRVVKKKRLVERLLLDPHMLLCSIAQACGAEGEIATAEIQRDRGAYRAEVSHYLLANWVFAVSI